MTWTCHVCGDERPDAMIAVWKTDTSEEYGLPVGTMQQNVRYCVDRAECRKGAKTYQHVEKSEGRPDQPIVSAPKYTAGVLVGVGLVAAGAFLVGWSYTVPDSFAYTVLGVTVAGAGAVGIMVRWLVPDRSRKT